MAKIIVTGSLGYDYIMNFGGSFTDRIMLDKIHSLSLSFLVEKLTKQFGGTAANIAYSLKLLGHEPLILASAGNDFAPYRRFLKSKELSTQYIAVYRDVCTSAYFVQTDKDDNQIGSFFVGATQYAAKLSIAKVLNRENTAKRFVIITATDPSAMKKFVKECRKLNLPYLYDPAFQIATFTPEELLEGIDGAQILIGNDYEIALIQKKLKISRKQLIVKVPLLVTTLGSKGSLLETYRHSVRIKRARAESNSDPTGAGDAYRAGLVSGLLRLTETAPIEKLTAKQLLMCGQMGSVAAVYTVEKYGTQTHSYTKQDFIRRYRQNFHSKIAL